jgi:N-acylneuraminate cytidylyltransferase
LREDADIESAVALHANGAYDIVMSVVARDRGVLKYGTLNGNHFVAMRDPAYCFENRQALPEVYGPNGAVYVFSAARFMESEGFPTARIGVVEMPANRSTDIDTAEDFRRVEDFMVANKSTKT